MLNLVDDHILTINAIVDVLFINITVLVEYEIKIVNRCT